MQLQALLPQNKAQNTRSSATSPNALSSSDFKAELSSHLNTQWASVSTLSHSLFANDTKQVPNMDKDDRPKSLERLLDRRRPPVQRAHKDQAAHKPKQPAPLKSAVDHNDDAQNSVQTNEKLSPESSNQPLPQETLLNNDLESPTIDIAPQPQSIEPPSLIGNFFHLNEDSNTIETNLTGQTRTNSNVNSTSEETHQLPQNIPVVTSTPQAQAVALSPELVPAIEAEHVKGEAIDTGVLSSVLTQTKPQNEQLVGNANQSDPFTARHGATLLDEVPTNSAQEEIDLILQQAAPTTLQENTEIPLVSDTPKTTVSTHNALSKTLPTNSASNLDHGLPVPDHRDHKDAAALQKDLGDNFNGPKQGSPVRQTGVPSRETMGSPNLMGSSNLDDTKAQLAAQHTSQKSETGFLTNNNLIGGSMNASHVNNALTSLKNIAETVGVTNKPMNSVDTLSTKIEGLGSGTTPKPTLEQILAKQGLTKTQASQKAVETISATISHKSIQGVKRFHIRLDPPELGRLDVRLDFGKDGANSAHILVERSETLDLLLKDRASLERALQQAGLNLKGSDLSFSLTKDQSNHAGQEPQDQGDSGSQRDDAQTSDPNEPEANYDNLVNLINGIDLNL